MTDCPSETIEFPACGKRRVAAAFDGGAVTSNGGALLLRQVDRRLGLTAAVAGALIDGRRRSKVIRIPVDSFGPRGSTGSP